jgi:hypothetical protein
MLAVRWYLRYGLRSRVAGARPPAVWPAASATAALTASLVGWDFQDSRLARHRICAGAGPSAERLVMR